MPGLLHSLRGFDLGYLNIVAELWGLELGSNDPEAAVQELSAAVRDERLAREIIASLSAEARTGLTTLAAAGGRIPWAGFVRRFGDVREMGAGRRDRQQPYLHAASASEILFYRALLARAFFDTDTGPVEFAYLPDEWLPLLQQLASGHMPAVEGPLGRPATPAERAHVVAADDRILDDATTWLSALRVGHPRRPDLVLQSLLGAAGILGGDVLRPDTVRDFLEASRPDALERLVKAWTTSEQFNELRLLPGLICEGAWINQPLQARRFVLALLDDIPRQTWWSLNALIADIKSRFPDFQRPAGDYDSWFIKNADGRYLRGFDDWDWVDGALIRFLITGVMHRLGLLDLAGPGDGEEPAAFRVSGKEPQVASRGAPTTDQASRFPSAENGQLRVTSRGAVTATRRVPRAARYQLARFCEWDEEMPEEYHYRITPRSLIQAGEQGLNVEHLLALLGKHTADRIPPVLVKALKRWKAAGTEARAETQVVLRVSRPEILQDLRKSKAARFLGEPLGTTTVVIKPGAQSKVIAALAELGLLAQDNTAALDVPPEG